MFSIGITLLVLDIRLPTRSGSLWHAVLLQWSWFLAYALSFMRVGVVWVSHRPVFHVIARVDLGLLWYNLLLLIVAFMLYPTVCCSPMPWSLVRARRPRPSATVQRSSCSACCSTSTWMHASRDHRLLHADTAPDVVLAMGVRLRTGSALCGVITLVAPIQVDPGLADYLLVLLYYGVTGIRRAE